MSEPGNDPDKGMNIYSLSGNSGNRLIHESSPYLLQHAHNPVDWYPWGQEAFEKAIKENKPLLVSIGYSACHWCHVMERESFENKEVAALMNEHFVSIKIDREERPDIDHIYMDAVQAISGSGGWPLNVFLTPDKKPFYGGTYFPPKRAFNRASWTEVLLSVSEAYHQRKEEIEHQAETLTAHLKASNSIGLSINEQAVSIFSENKIGEAYKNILKAADSAWGGFGKAPKFPQTFTITFLMRYAHVFQNKEALQQVVLSLDKMGQGGIYDHIGGGFARYATDDEWLVPHFEKMLYDNALLINNYSEAYQLTGNEFYKEVIEETLSFIEKELTHKDGGFYSALDADSEGEEGKYYVWDYEDVKTILQNDADLFCRYFDITAAGNWEEKNIPRVKVSPEEFAGENNIAFADFKNFITENKRKLLQKREKRIKPLLDDKILLGWNALMNTAYSKAYAAIGNEAFKFIAERNMQFLLRAFKNESGGFYHTCKENKAKYEAFLDDYAYLVAALIELGQITSQFAWLDTAKEITELVLENFADDETPFFFFTNKAQQDVLLRKKEIYDGATPSGNSIMAQNLYRLSIFFDKPEWRQKAEDMVKAIGEIAIKYPTSFGVWTSLLFEIITGTNEIAVVGVNQKNYLPEILKIFIPHKVVMASDSPDDTYPLLAGKGEKGKTYIYLCKNYSCLQPVSTVADLVSLLSFK